jgi:hypothetical protein
MLYESAQPSLDRPDATKSARAHSDSRFIKYTVSDISMTKVLPVFLALIPFAALIGACSVTG